ncbi:MAG: serine O-acetyltransferase EpsC [Bacteroidales bacterium]
MNNIAQALTDIQMQDESLTRPCCNARKLLCKTVQEFVHQLYELFFPIYFGEKLSKKISLLEFNQKKIEYLYQSLPALIAQAFCFAKNEKPTYYSEISTQIAKTFIEQLPIMAKTLITDVQATYNNDPAAQSHSEIILAYPGIRASISHRIAHQLYKTKVPILPRIIAEMAHAKTGIDIHPGANIGNNFVIDHGTGVVIGETTIIGNNVTIYQGVTLGAKKIHVDGILVKNQPRHPYIEDNVTIYAGATILGCITIGKGSIIGGNVWLTKSVPANSHINRSSTLPTK